MRKKSTNYKHLLYSLLLAIALLTGLFGAVGFIFQPPPAAAQTLAHPNLGSIDQAPVTIIASPSPFLIQATSIATLYLPLIFRNPQPSFWDNFSDKDSDWPEGTDSNCTSAYNGDRYQLDVDNDEECFRFAPSSAERIFGTFEVSLYHSDGESSEALFGIYFNGSGGNKQYIFRIRPNVSTSTCSSGGQWELRRRWVESDGDTRDDLIQRACESIMKRGYGSSNTNTIRAKHTDTGQIILYINSKQIYLFNEGSDSPPELTGKGTGVYVRAPSNKDIVVKFDDFKVYPLSTSP